jgi:uncharacterized protein (UPF0303 family)
MNELDDKNRLLAELLSQEEELSFRDFTFEDAWGVGNEFARLANLRSLPVAGSIFLGEQRVFHVALKGASSDSNSWIDRKCNLVMRFGHSSLAVKTQFEIRGKNFDLDSQLSLKRYSAFGGSFPIIVNNLRVGCLGISGLPHFEDHALTVEVLRNFKAFSKGKFH